MANMEFETFNVKNIESQISEIIGKDAWWNSDFDQIDLVVRNLEELIFSLQDDDLVFSKRFMSTVPLDILTVLNDGYCYWETEIENRFANRILTEFDTVVEDYMLYNRFGRLLTKEINLLNGYDFDSVIFIGSGPFPITAILFHKLTGKRVDCLELDVSSAKTSEEVFKKLNLSDHMTVHVGDGGEYDLGEYDVILNALLAKPKFKIMQNVIRSGREDCQILCRTSDGLRQLLYESTSEDIINGFNVKGIQNAGYDDTISTVLLSKKNRR